MSNTIEIMIRKCEFTKDDIIMATHGECMWFAIALNDILTNRLIKSELVVATMTTSPDDHWRHALVEHRHEYYDIRGKVHPRDIHTEYKTDLMRESSRDKLIHSFAMRPHDVDDKIAVWNKRLIDNVASLSMDS